MYDITIHGNHKKHTKCHTDTGLKYNNTCTHTQFSMLYINYSGYMYKWTYCHCKHSSMSLLGLAPCPQCCPGQSKAPEVPEVGAFWFKQIWILHENYICATTSKVTVQLCSQVPVCLSSEVLAWLSVCCLERGADLHMAQLMPLPLIVSCFSKIQIGFTFLVLAHPGSPGQRAVKWVCVFVPVCHTRLHQ